MVAWSRISVVTQPGMCTIEEHLTGLRYQDETFDPYIPPYVGAIGNYLILADNAQPYHTIAGC